MGNMLCLAAALVAVLLSPPDVLATVELSKFLNAHLDNRLFVDNTLFVTSLVRSRLDCARQCASYLGCVTFTYSRQGSSDHETCRGHSSSVATESINDTAIEAKTYSLSLDLCVGGNYAVIDDFRRHVDNTENAYLCDTLVPGWYRFFINGSSASIPTHCPPAPRCGTTAPMWLDLQNATLPLVGKEAQARACPSLGNDCCYSVSVTPVILRNCGNFYVYNLQPTTLCSLAYCAEL